MRLDIIEVTRIAAHQIAKIKFSPGPCSQLTETQPQVANFANDLCNRLI